MPVSHMYHSDTCHSAPWWYKDSLDGVIYCPQQSTAHTVKIPFCLPREQVLSLMVHGLGPRKTEGAHHFC